MRDGCRLSKVLRRLMCPGGSCGIPRFSWGGRSLGHKAAATLSHVAVAVSSSAVSRVPSIALMSSKGQNQPSHMSSQ